MKRRYFEEISRKSIIVYGIYPPPFGGVSVHIQRVSDALSSAYNKLFFFDIEQPSRRFFLPYYCLKLCFFLGKKRPDIVHFHGTYLRTMIVDLCFLFIGSYLFRYEITIIDHDCRHLHTRAALTKWVYRQIVKRIRKVVMIGGSVLHSYEDVHIIPDCYVVENAFLPPLVQSAPSIRVTYPSSLFTFMNDHTPLILMNAAHIMLNQSEDVYGLDAAVAMMSQLKKQYPDAGLIMAIAQVNNVEYMHQLYLTMKRLDCAEQIYILRDQKELWPLFQLVDLFIRPTLSDGSSISVQEALYFNVPVVASDAVDRLPSVHLYTAGDTNSFTQRVECVLREYVYENQRKRDNLHQKSA